MKKSKIKFQPVLHLFYRELWQWIVDGMPQHPIFRRDGALCVTLDSWLFKNFTHFDDDKLISACLQTQTDLFNEDYGVTGYPFNKDSNSFYNESDKKRLYLNLHRTAFIHRYSQRRYWPGYEA